MDMAEEDPVIHENLRMQDETAAQKLRKRFDRLTYLALLVLRLSFILLPIFLLSLICLDLPFRTFDRFVGMSSDLAISNWFSRGDAIMALSIFYLMLVTRSYGSIFTGRLLTLCWLMTAGFVGAMIIFLAPQLVPGDLPSTRFVIGFLSSWYVGQLVAIYVYDYTRGGNWWRAPFYGGVFGFAVQSAIYFPVIYGEAGTLWISWMIIDTAMKCVFCLAFLPAYSAMRRLFRPYLGQISALET
ncbi:hypothetical protein [Parvularcula sp. IMCC14364]|uniref:hypothetical protein n=1 Tax=Parvularcula sp. IMCC14364 TaxID=3067902 RepID=UPI0027416252|nr:hypothetical protein [Parvularcula sp. IMCC14364]